jgi:uncharacterized protein (TIRG00374 family)
MGEVIRCTVLNQTNNIPVNKSFGTVILERVIDVLMLGGLVSLVLITKWDLFGDFFVNEIFNKKSSSSISIIYSEVAIRLYKSLVLALIITLMFRWKKIRQYDWKKKFYEIKLKVLKFLKGIGDGVLVLFKMKRKGEFIFHSLFIWAMYFVMTWVCVFAYDPTSALSAFDGLFLMVVGGLGMTAPVQGGFGAFHYLVEKALLLYDIKPSIDAITGSELRPGLVFATIVHSTQFIMTLMLGLTAVILVALKKKKKNAKEAA